MVTNETKKILLAGAAIPGALGMMRGFGLARATFGPNDDSGAGGDNTGGNTGGGGTGDSGQDNAGADAFAATFWDDPEEDKSGSPSGGSADSGKPPSGNNQELSEGQQFAQKLSSLTFGDVFTEAEMRKMSEDGDLTGVNKAIGEQLKQATHSAVTLTAELMQKNNQALMTTFKSMIQEALGGEKNEDTLLKEFPAAKDARVRPMIQQVFDQALKKAKGNRPEAVRQTKEMLRIMGSTAGNELGVPPRGAGDVDYQSNGAQSLVDNLLAR